MSDSARATFRAACAFSASLSGPTAEHHTSTHSPHMARPPAHRATHCAIVSSARDSGRMEGTVAARPSPLRAAMVTAADKMRSSGLLRATRSISMHIDERPAYLRVRNTLSPRAPKGKSGQTHVQQPNSMMSSSGGTGRRRSMRSTLAVTVCRSASASHATQRTVMCVCARTSV